MLSFIQGAGHYSPERIVRFWARRNPIGRISIRPAAGSSLLNAWATREIDGDSALGVEPCSFFPVHVVEIECAFTATPQHAKDLAAFNPVISRRIKSLFLSGQSECLEARSRGQSLPQGGRTMPLGHRYWLHSASLRCSEEGTNSRPRSKGRHCRPFR